MSTERRQREAIVPGPEEEDPIGIALSKTLRECFDELGVPGCANCPVQVECDRLWCLEVEDAGQLNVSDYRRLEGKFALIKQRRDAILAQRERGVYQFHNSPRTHPMIP